MATTREQRDRHAAHIHYLKLSFEIDSKESLHFYARDSSSPKIQFVNLKTEKYIISFFPAAKAGIHKQNHDNVVEGYPKPLKVQSATSMSIPYLADAIHDVGQWLSEGELCWVPLEVVQEALHGEFGGPHQ